MSEKTTYGRLAERFPTEAHKTLARAGGQTYVPWNLVAERLNLVLGFEHWSFRIIREGFTSTEAWALGELTATIDGTVTVRQQYGVAPLTMGQREAPNDDLMKKVGTDALKKCAQVLGVALYLTDADERSEVQADMRAEQQAAEKAKREGQGSPADSSRVRKAAMAGGANPTTGPTAVGRRCREDGCDVTLADDATVSILKKKEGPRVEVKVAEFAPVCIERLKGFYCAEHYDQRYWGAA